MSITQYEDNILRVNWTFHDPELQSFRVPSSIASDKGLKVCENCKLEGIVEFSPDQQSLRPVLQIRDTDTSEVVFSMSDVAMSENFLFMNATVTT